MTYCKVLLEFLLLCLGTNAQTLSPTYILSFVQNPSGVLTADTNVAFRCEAVVTNISWLIDGVRHDNSTSTSEFQIMTQSINSSFTLSTLSTRAKGNENNTQIICIATGFNSIVDNRTSNIVIAATPLPPFLQVLLVSNGSNLQVMWDRPFTMSGFPVTSYTLDIVNKTDGERIKVILDRNLMETMNYNYSSSGYPVSCNPLSFSVIASNAVGESRTSNIIEAGFSVFPRTDNVTMHVDLDTTSAVTQLTVTFLAPEVCGFQDPATYTIGIFDESGDEILVTDVKQANTSTVVEVINARVERGSSYSAELAIRHHDVPGEVYVTFIGINFDTSVSTTTKGTNSAGNFLPTIVVLVMGLLCIINNW